MFQIIRLDINREATKISELSSGKIDKYRYLIVKETLSPNQSRMKKQAKSTYSPLGKAFENQVNITEN